MKRNAIDENYPCSRVFHHWQKCLLCNEELGSHYCSDENQRRLQAVLLNLDISKSKYMPNYRYLKINFLFPEIPLGNVCSVRYLDPVVQSIVGLTSSLRSQLVKCFTALIPNKLIFFLKNVRSFCNAKTSPFFSIKILV